MFPRFLLVFSLFFSFKITAHDFNFEPILITNMENTSVFPRNYRITKIPQLTNTSPPNWKGFDSLNLIGSAQFSKASLELVLENLSVTPCHIHILDLREEWHGFINGAAVSWYAFNDWNNVGKTQHQIECEEKELLNSLLKQKEIQIGKIINKRSKEQLPPEIILQPSIKVETTQTERELVCSYGLKYVNIPITDHIRPNDYQVDRFIDFICTLQKNEWVYIHCAAGIGRTSTFMIMCDMMMNAKNVSFKDIIDRQTLIGGKAIMQSTSKHWKIEIIKDRQKFLKDFYDYCKTNQNHFKTTWSRYLIDKKIPTIDKRTT